MQFEAQHILIQDTFLGDLQVRYYGIIIVTAMMIAALVAAHLARRRGMNADHIWGGLTWAIIPGIILARLWFVLFPPVSLTAGCGSDLPNAICQDTAWYLANFFNTNNGAIAIWSGGLSIFGAVLGGLIGAYLYTSSWHNKVARVFYILFMPITIPISFISWLPEYLFRRLILRQADAKPFKIEGFKTDFPDSGMPIMPWLDIAAVALPLAQFIGRWANYINQELYGVPTTLPWGITIEAEYRHGIYKSLIEYPADTLFHPLFLYEGLWSLAAFFILYRLFIRQADRFRIGDFFLLYLMQYSVIRFLLEFLRVEIAYIPGTEINSSQAFTVVVFVLALVGFLINRSRPVRQETPTPQAQPIQETSA